jgi:hypothetical protein
MYKFEYQGSRSQESLSHGQEFPIFTCIVPADWLSMELPTVGGCVNYANNREKLVSSGPVVFEFSDVVSTDETSRTISLDIFHSGVKYFERPVAIRCPNVERNDSGEKCFIEVLLLNQLFGYNAPSVLVDVDFQDFIAIMAQSSTYDFKYGIGETPSDILPKIIKTIDGKDVKCEFVMIFCDDQKMSLEYLQEIMDAMPSSKTDESLDLQGIVCAVGVAQSAMLISALVGYK